MEWAMLGGLDEGARRAVLAATTRRKYRKGDTVFYEGDPGDTLHLIDRGHVAVRISTPSGEIATLVVLAPGDCFGELALVGPLTQRTATIVALDDVETKALHRHEFDDLRNRQPAVGEFITLLLAHQVRRLSGQVLEALYTPVDKRVVRRLNDLCATYGAETPGPVTIPITQEDLATMAGTTRPTANKVLQELVDAGVIALGRGRTEILDRAALARKAK